SATPPPRPTPRLHLHHLHRPAHPIRLAHLTGPAAEIPHLGPPCFPESRRPPPRRTRLLHPQRRDRAASAAPQPRPTRQRQPNAPQRTARPPVRLVQIGRAHV